VRVVIPPLRERPEDIPLLVEHFASRALPPAKSFSVKALEALQAYDWPGNVRELLFAVERAGLLAEGGVIEPFDLPPEIHERGRAAEAPGAALAAATSVSAAQPAGAAGDEEFDAAQVRRALEQAKWRRGKAAELLGVSPRTLYRWMKRLEL